MTTPRAHPLWLRARLERVAKRPELSAGVIFLLCALALPAQQVREQPNQDYQALPDAVKLEKMVITGSNIQRLEIEKVLPVTVLNSEMIQVRNAVTPVELLTALPQVTGVPQNEASLPATARGDLATLNLRGIGPSSSLILLNGRRLAQHPTSAISPLGFAVNVNQLPTQGISRIDVLRDGASSIYGSDAVAGVINYVMRDDYRGTELKLRYGYPERGGGQNVQSTLTHGMNFAGGKGNLLTTLDVLYRDAIYLKDRKFSANSNHSAEAPPPFNVVGSVFDGRTLVGYFPTFQFPGSTATNYFRPVNGTTTLTTVAPVRATNPEYFLNYNDQSMGLTRSGRLNWTTGLKYSLNDRIAVFGDLLLYRADSQVRRAPVQINAPSGGLPGPVSVDNPFNPYGSRFYSASGAPNADGTPRLTGTPRAIDLYSVILRELPADQGNVRAQNYRIVAGLRGKLTDTWNWETGATFSRAHILDQAPYGVRDSYFFRALGRSDATAYNPFGYTFKVQGGAVVSDQPYTNPKSVVDTIVDTWKLRAMSDIASLDARASGRVLTLWGGDISLAVGGEYRRESFDLAWDPYSGLNPPGSGLDPLQNDFLVASPRPNSNGNRTVASLYGETVIPLVGSKNDIAVVNSLELTGSVRLERYSDFGKTTKPKLGVNWKPVATVMVRASYNEGFTAPTLPVLYQTAQYGSGTVGNADPYRNTATNEGLYLQRGYTSGNPALRPTGSKGKTAGIVFDVPKIKGLTFTADYWQLRQNDVISSRNADEIRNNDALLLRAYTQQQLAAGVPIGAIALGSGTAAYKGDSSLTRLAPTAQDNATFAAYNATRPASSQLAVAGKIFATYQPFLNLAEGYLSGWDFGVNYALPRLPVGRITLSSEWSNLQQYYTTLRLPNAAPVINQRVNLDGATRWRGTTTLAWRRDKWSGALSAYYIGSYAAGNATTSAAVYESLGRPSYLDKAFDGGVYVYRYVVHDVTTYNASLAYRFGPEAIRWVRNSSVRLGVSNLLDRAPPLAPGIDGYSASVHGTIFVGRQWMFDLSRQF